MPYSNPITQNELADLALHNPLHPRDGSPNEQYMPQAYFLVPPPTQAGPVKWRLFDAAYISTGIIDPNRLGTGSTGAGNLYLADDGTWKPVSGGGGGGGDMYKATYDVDNDGTVDSAERIEIIVRNSTGSTLTKGTVVYLSGATGNRPNAVRAQANSEATSSKTFGFVVANINNNSDGYVACNGTLHDLDTSAFADGTALWLSPTVAGGWTSTVPSEPNHSVFLGYVARSHPTQGRVVILIQNGYELNELHDVVVPSPTNGDLLQWDAVNAYWKNVAVSAAVPTPTLAQVTTAGNTTTNSITVGNLNANGQIVTRGATLPSYAGDGSIVAGGTNISGSSGVLLGVQIPYVSGAWGGHFIGYSNQINPKWLIGISRNVAQENSLVYYEDSAAANPRFAIHPGGNVTIGTITDAGYKLDVNGTARMQSDVTVLTNLSVGFTGAFGRFNVRGADNSSSGRAITVQNQSQTLIFDIYNDGKIFLNPQGSGNVIVGTIIDSGHKLRVNGTVSAVLTNATYANAVYYNTTTGELTYGAAGGGATPTLAQVTSAGNTTTNSITVGGLTVDTDTLVVDATNNRVGIGTLSPSARLDIAGVTSGVAFKVSGGVAGYTNQYFYINEYGSAAMVGNTIDSNNLLFGGLGASDTFARIAFGFLSGNPYIGLGPGSTTRDIYLSRDNGDLKFGFTASNTERLRIRYNGNVLINTTTDSGYKLDVNGTARVQGRLIMTGDYIQYGSNPNVAIGSTSTGASFSDSSSSLLYASANILTSAVFAHYFFTGTFNATSGNQGVITTTTATFSPTSGTATFTGINLAFTINQTGGANGITRGLYINPTITAAADFRAIQTTAGKVIHQGLTNATHTNVVYYNTATGELTHGAAPTGGGGGGNFVIDYDYNIVGAKDGINTNFSTTVPYILGTTRVYLNGQRLTPGVGYDYLELNPTQISLFSPPVPSDQLIIEYETT